MSKRIELIDRIKARVARLLVLSAMGYDIVRNIADLDGKDFTTKDMLIAAGPVAPIPPIDISGGTSYTYAYDGRFGANPTTYFQYYTGNGWKTVGWADIQDDGTLLAEGDFSSGQWQLIVK
jgi:hypothetical protein